MNCKDIKRNLSAYLDGELSPACGDAFFDHLQACESCCDLVGEASFNEALLANAMKVHMTAPASIRYNVLNAISREKARPVFVPAWRRLAWRPATATAAMLALASVGWRTFTASLQPEPTVAKQAEPVKVAQAPAIKAVPRTIIAAPAIRPRPTAAPAASKRIFAAPVVTAHKTVTPVTHPAPPAPTLVAEAPIGTIMEIRTPGNLANGRFLSRVDGNHAWRDAAADVRVKTRMQSAEDTIVTIQLKDGTIVKTNAHTEFVVQRSPTRDNPSWELRLMRGELWVKAATDVTVIAPTLDVRTTSGEFGVRSIDGEDSTVIVSEGLAAAHNAYGTSLVAASQATVAVAGEAPREAFAVSDPRGQMEWAYAPTPAHNPQDDGGTQS